MRTQWMTWAKEIKARWEGPHKQKDTSATETEVKNANLGIGISSNWGALLQNRSGLELF